MGKEDKTINVVFAGHVDHGKSTILGRMLSDAGALPEGKLEKVQRMCERNSKPFEYAFLIDALKDEQAQGITIDSARVFFRTDERDYQIIDAPGHIEFLKNMVTGASRAGSAFLVVDASEGIRENSRRHGFLLSILGIRQISVLVNKMDLVSYDEKSFRDIESEYRQFLSRIDIEPLSFIPVSGIKGVNITRLSGDTSWYSGKTVLEAFRDFTPEDEPCDKPFRMPVQDVYKFTNFGDKRRIISGTVVSGKVRPGDEVIFLPSGKKSRVSSIEGFNVEKFDEAGAGEAAGITLDEQIYVKRGEIAIKKAEGRPSVTSKIKVSLFWLGRMPMTKDKSYIFKLGTARVSARLEKIDRIFDSSDLDNTIERETIEKNTVAECVINLSKPVAFDLVKNIQFTGRFVIVDDYDISGGGITLAALEDEQSWVREKVLLRDYKWEKSMIPYEKRAEKFMQQSAVVFITGERDVGKKKIAKALEEELFEEGRLVYFLGIGNILYGVDADIKGVKDDVREHLRRLAEVAHIMLDAGIIVIITAVELTQENIELMRTAIGTERVKTVWVGGNITTNLDYDINVNEEPASAVTKIKDLLAEEGIIVYDGD